MTSAQPPPAPNRAGDLPRAPARCPVFPVADAPYGSFTCPAGSLSLSHEHPEPTSTPLSGRAR
jgi:hypothetical protein